MLIKVIDKYAAMIYPIINFYPLILLICIHVFDLQGGENGASAVLRVSRVTGETQCMLGRR